MLCINNLNYRKQKMKLASYKGTRPGIQGIGNILIRWRLEDQISHSELIFEPGDLHHHLVQI
jgi:hypothetical protein